MTAHIKDKEENNRRIQAEFKKNSRFNFIDTSRVKNIDILWLFIRWHATPPKDRNPLTQKAFSIRYKVSEDSLTDWKRLTGFWDEVKNHRPQQLRELTIKIDLGLADRAMKGNPKAVELWHKIYEGFNEKIEVEGSNPPPEITPEEREKINRALKNIGLASIIKRNSRSDDEK